jgi:dTMP kinase
VNLPRPYQPQDRTAGRHPFIVLEGVSGIGKSTLARLLAQRLNATSLHTLTLPHSDWSSAVNTQLRALPQFAFYLSGVLHASDKVRRARQVGAVVADRYVSSVIACHAAVHEVEVQVVTELITPFRPYTELPTHTFYLRCSEAALRDRMAAKQDLKQDDTELFTVPGRLTRLLENFAAVAADDPSAVPLDTDGKTPDDLADWILTHLEAQHA